MAECRNVWRVEFQLRREALKAYGVETVDGLITALAGMWQDLSTNWYSIRLQDNANVTRRTVHPWWRMVQESAAQFGPLVGMRRVFVASNAADEAFYIARAAGNLLGYAAAAGLPDFHEALDEFAKRIQDRWAGKDFVQEYAIKAVQISGPVGQSNHEPEGEEDVPF